MLASLTRASSSRSIARLWCEPSSPRAWLSQSRKERSTEGSAARLLEAVANAGISAAHVRRLGFPDRFVEHGERGELLADLGLDVAGIVATVREWTSEAHLVRSEVRRSR